MVSFNRLELLAQMNITAGGLNRESLPARPDGASRVRAGNCFPDLHLLESVCFNVAAERPGVKVRVELVGQFQVNVATGRVDFQSMVFPQAAQCPMNVTTGRPYEFDAGNI